MNRRSKHNAVKLRAYIGTQDCKFDSKAEYRYALWLENERQEGRIVSWRHHPCVFTLVGAQFGKVATMEPDFSVVWPNGNVEYHEVKGMPTAAWRIKRALFEQQSDDAYVVIDAGHPGDVITGTPPRLFDERSRYKRLAKKAKKARADMNAEKFLRKIGRRK